MKLTTALLLVFSLQISAHGYSQKITLNLKNVPIVKVFKEIHKQTGFNFFYNTEMLKQIGRVSVQVSDADLPEVLDKCLSSQPLHYSIVNNTIILSEKPARIVAEKTGLNSVPTPPANIEVSGIVTDVATGKPLTGASVNIKGGGAGTSTDQNGFYNISVPDKGAALVFSFVGYESAEIRVSKAGTVNISLKVKVTQGDEIVVVGYGTQKKKEVTMAVSQVSGAEVLKSQSVTISNSLAGKIPGLVINQRNSRPGADGATFFIRGQSTTGDGSALIVVDGIANRDGIDRIDPNDIESITVLKDASAAIYGAQSANGAILITTKRGKAGKPKVAYSYNHGLVSPVRLIKMSDAATYLKGVNDVALQQGAAIPYTDQVIADYASGKTPSTDWLAEVYKSYFTQDRHSLTLSGGNETVKYFLSGGLTGQNTILTDDNTSKYRQYNFRSNVDIQASKRLSIGFDVSGRRQNSDYPYQDENTIFSAAVLTSPTLAATIDGLPTRGRSNNNPLAISQSAAYDKTQFNIISGTVRFDYSIPKVQGLSVDGFAAIDYTQTFRKRWQQPQYFYEKDANGVLQKLPNNTATSLNETYSQQNSFTLNARLKYERVFSKLHSVNAFIAAEKNNIRNDNFQATRVGFISPQLDQLFAGGANNQSNNGLASERARLNYFGRAAYAFDSKYLLQFQFRYDGSQRFPTDKRFGFFPGVSAGWVVSEENFFKTIKSINYLKVRSSYGVLGNDRIGDFQYLNNYALSSGPNSGYVINGSNNNVLNPGVVGNPNVTWERKNTFDIGLEGRVLNNKLSFEVDYFASKTFDILLQRNNSVPLYTGLNSGNRPPENIGIVNNKGIDGQVNYRATITKDLTFNIGGNFTYAKNTLTFIDEGTQFKETPYQKAEGKPIGAPLIYQVIGIYRNQSDIDKYPSRTGTGILGDAIFEDVNKDGVINSSDAVRSDYTNTPRIQYGILFGAQYKNFDLSGNFVGQAKAYAQFGYVYGEGSNTAEYYVKNAWSPSNPNGSLPRIGRNLYFTDGLGNTTSYRSVAFLRLKNIELGYNMPKQVLSRVGIQGVRIYVNAYNILTFDKLKKDGLQDPEEINPQAWQFPQTKSVNFGVNVNL